MTDFFDWTQYLPDLFGGLGVALKLTGLSLVFGYPLGLLLAAATSSPQRLTRAIAVVVVEIGRGLPLLVLLFLIYQGFPQAGFTPTAFASATAAFSFSAAAYSTEILRAALGSVPPGQREAAAAAGMSDFDAFRDVVFPQAARIALPPLMSLAIQLFQITSLAYLVTVPEVMQAAYFRGTVTFDYLGVFVAAAFLYAAITLPSTALVSILERRLGRHT